ncbi:MAG: ASKHA domain-containing protein [Thermoguttaceae bacterium]
MRDPEVLVRFRPSGREAYVLPGVRLIEAAAEVDLIVLSPCGGEGTCGKCRVRVASGVTEPNPVERRWLSADELATGWRLACQTSVAGPMDVDIPAASRSGEHQILVRTESPTEPPADDPPVRTQPFEVAPPRRGDDAPDSLRLERTLNQEPLEMDLPLLRELTDRLQSMAYRGTAVLAGHRLLDLEPDDAATDALAVALDIGTTTLVGELLYQRTGESLAIEARLNPQTRFGDDVLSRILYARQNDDGLEQLQQAVVEAVNEMIATLCRKADVSQRHVYNVTLAGNTTMQQLLCGVDVRPLGQLPFTPASARAMNCRAVELGLDVHPRAIAYVMPVIGGFVGGDTVAGLLATGLADADGPAMLVDIGTNGEIVLQANGRLWAASTAAGPAFEGARISCGMRGCDGAIEKVVVADGRLHIGVIGNAAPAGVCGSGLIDAAAELLRHGILSPQGQLLAADQTPVDTPPDLVRRLQFDPQGKPIFVLAEPSESAEGRAIALTQRDFRELQLAAGAMRAGAILLLRRAGLRSDQLGEVLIAGGFGNFIRRSNAERIGLLPQRLEHHRIRYVGNASLAGARRGALSQQARQAAEQLARRTEHVDLSTDPDFQEAFADAMIFP